MDQVAGSAGKGPALVALLPLIAFAVAAPLLTPSWRFASPGSVLGGAWLLLILAVVLEFRSGQLENRRRRLVAYLIALWAGGYLILLSTVGPLPGPAPLGLLGLPVALFGWIPVGWLSLVRDQPSLAHGRASPFLFSAIWALVAGIVAHGY